MTKVRMGGVPSAALLMEQLPDAVAGFDASYAVTFSNPAAQRFFGLSEKQLAEKNLSGLFDVQQAVFEAAETAARKNRTVTLCDVTVAGKFVSSLSIVPVEPQQCYMMIIRHQPLELASEWNEKTRYSLESTQMVARMVAHEIKNPLAGIRGAAQLLERADLAAEDKELATLISREAARILALADSFDVFYDVPAENYKPVNLHEVLHRATGLARAQFGEKVKITENFDPSLPEVRGHFDHLVQAKLNLIKNAAEALAEKKQGHISIRTFYDPAAPFHPERAEKLPLCVEIEDDGDGIPPEAASRIFQPYFTTKPNGKGLGLPVVSRIVDSHGGTIKVESRPGRTVFRISLPAPRPQEPA